MYTMKTKTTTDTHTATSHPTTVMVTAMMKTTTDTRTATSHTTTTTVMVTAMTTATRTAMTIATRTATNMTTRTAIHMTTAQRSWPRSEIKEVLLLSAQVSTAVSITPLKAWRALALQGPQAMHLLPNNRSICTRLLGLGYTSAILS